MESVGAGGFSWEVVGRYSMSDYLTRKGLQSVTGVLTRDFAKSLVKDALDNCMDAVDNVADPRVSLLYWEGTNRFVMIARDNGAGLSPELVEKIFDYRWHYSSKYFVKRPLRGALGVGLQLIPCIAYACGVEEGLEPGYLVVRSFGVERKVSDPYVDDDGNLKVNISPPRKCNVEKGTEVEVVLPGCWWIGDYPLDLVLLNPHITFEVNGVKYERVAPLTLWKGTSIQFYTLAEFSSLALSHKQHEPGLKLTGLLTGFHGVNSTKARGISEKVGVRFLSELDDVAVKAIYEELCKASPPVNARNLGFIGRRPLTKRLRQIFGEVEDEAFHYRMSAGYRDKGRIPYGLEVASCKIPGLGSLKLVFGLNQSVPVYNPLPLYWLNVGGEQKDIWQILSSCGMKKDEPVIVMSHLHIPEMLYGGRGKAVVDLGGQNILKNVGVATYDACKWYRGWKAMQTEKIDWTMVREAALKLVDEYYWKGGLPLTVRQIFYRLASSLLIRLDRNSYNTLDRRLVDIRREGVIPWEAISDRSRYTIEHDFHNLTPENAAIEALNKAENYVGRNPWDDLGIHIEVWLEKDALTNFIKTVTSKYYITLAPHRGYSSWSYIYDGAQRLREASAEGKKCIVISLGDHDASGIDIYEHLQTAIDYFKIDAELKRIALTYEQTQNYNLPSSPLKKADPRAKKYRKLYKDKVWEIDALEPRTLLKILEDEIKTYIRWKMWDAVIEENEEAKRETKRLSEKMKQKIQNL